MSGKDGTELLAEAPGVWLDSEKISINGAQGARVFVDDRELHLSGEELMSYLRSLKSEDIRRIEVVPMAGSEYEASTRAGVIRITLRQRQEYGAQGYLSMAGGISPGAYMPSAAVNARVGRWTLSGSASASFTPEAESKLYSRRSYAEEGHRFESFSHYAARINYGTGRLGAILTLDTLRSLGVELSYTSSAYADHPYSRTALTVAALPQSSTGNYTQEKDYHTLSATANYLWKLDGHGSAFKLIADYMRRQSEDASRQAVRYEGQGWTRDTLYRYQMGADYDLATLDGSFRKSLSEKSAYQFGARYAFMRMDDRSFYEGMSEGVWLPRPDYGHRLRYREHIGGVYGSLSSELWGNLSYVAGLRAEYARTAGRSGALDRDYWDLFPSLNLTYAFDPMKRRMLVGQYARNIERPPFRAMNPSRVQHSDYSYEIGNPYLRPTYINRFSLTFVLDYRYTLTVGGNLHKDLIRENSEQDPDDPEVSFVTFKNHDRENHWFIALSLPFQPWSWLSLNTNFVGVRQDIRSVAVAPYETHYLAFANATATLSLPAEVTLEARYNGTSRLYSANSEVVPFHTVGLTAKKRLGKRRWLITFSADNLFDRLNRFVSRMADYRTDTRYESAAAGRRFKLSLTWNFNSGKRVKPGKIETGSASERSRFAEK